MSKGLAAQLGVTASGRTRKGDSKFIKHYLVYQELRNASPKEKAARENEVGTYEWLVKIMGVQFTGDIKGAVDALLSKIEAGEIKV